MRACDLTEPCPLPTPTKFDDTIPRLPHFGLTVRLRRQAYDEHGNKLPFAVLPGDRVVTYFDITENTPMKTFTCAVIPDAPHIELYGLVMVLDAASQERAVEIATAAYRDCAASDAQAVKVVCAEGDDAAAMIAAHAGDMRPEPEHRDYEWPTVELPPGISKIFGTP